MIPEVEAYKIVKCASKQQYNDIVAFASALPVELRIKAKVEAYLMQQVAMSITPMRVVVRPSALLGTELELINDKED